MTSTYIIADNIISSLGFTTEENIKQILSGHSGISNIQIPGLPNKDVLAAKIDRNRFNNTFDTSRATSYTFLESLFIHSISKVIEQVPFAELRNDTILILSTTKGNIDQFALDRGQNKLIPEMASVINKYFELPYMPLVVSNACTSGISAIILANTLLRSGRYKHAIVAGGDIIDPFIMSGFQSLMAISEKPCKPYDANRSGITLGEACGSVFITSEDIASGSKILGTGQSNDANHISGPSRDGGGLIMAIKKTMRHHTQIDMISAHGTATAFNDEMESKAFHALQMDHISLNSLKPYWGHTLGAAGIIETIALIYQLKNDTVAATLGYENNGVSHPLHVSAQNIFLTNSAFGLKTISGFGGFNAALLIEA